MTRPTVPQPLAIHPSDDVPRADPERLAGVVADAGRVPVVTIDPERGRVVRANAHFAALVGVSPEALPGLPIAEFDGDGGLDAGATDGGPRAWRAVWRHRGGHTLRVACHGRARRDPDTGRSLLTIAVETDRRARFAAAARALAAEADHPLGPAALWLDARGVVVHANEAFGLLIGCEPAGFEGAVVASIVPDLGGDVWTQCWQVAQDGLHATIEVSVIRTAPDEASFPATCELHAADVDVDPLACAFIEDATAQTVARRELARARERYALAALGANDGLWDWDLATAQVHYSSRWASLLGFRAGELAPTPETWLGRIHPDERARVEDEIARHLEGDTPYLSSEHRVLHRDARYRWMLVRGVAVPGADGEAARMAGSAADITHRKQAEARLRFEASHDPLTGLANRALLIRTLHHALTAARDARARGERRLDALLFIDLDGFKLVNDSLGHQVGDMLLRAMATRMKRCIRPSDLAARIGGDEFTVLLTDVADAEAIERVADRVQEAIARPFDLRGYEVVASASVGVALADAFAAEAEAEDVIRDANIALYRAKGRGRGHRVVFDASMRRALVGRLTLETELRRALEREELDLHYQPIVGLREGRIEGVEALLRWDSRVHGWLSPGAFVHLAEETGLIVPIGRWVLRAACAQALAWDAELDVARRLGVSVNLSARQVALPYLPEQVQEVLDATGLAPSRLHLEITETVLMDDAEGARAMLRRLKDLGVSIHMDDFGTAYSSLAYLHRFPIDTLKIDRSFISGAGPYEDPWAIVETIRSLADRLSVRVTAEGVETSEQLERLRAIGVDAVQGYLFSRPKPPRELAALLAGHPRW